MNAVVVNQDTLHFKVGLLTIFLLLKLYEGVLQAVAGSSVSNDLARQNLPKPTEDEVQVLILGNRIEFANE
jgi:hypothetical protein